MTNWELFRNLCLIIGGQDSKALGEVIDQDGFPRLVKLAQDRELLPALATRLNEQANLKDRVPAEFYDQLQQALIENTQKKFQIMAQAIKLTRVLNAEGIEPLFLKGTAQLLTNPDVPVGFRKQVDIDLLVAPKQIDAACEAMKKDGYLFFDTRRPESETFTDTARAREISAHHHHLPPMGKPGYEATVELHKYPLRRRFQGALSREQMAQSAVAYESHGARFSIPSPGCQLLHLTLGEFIHDGYAARYEFPIRAGRDYIGILSQASGRSAAQLHVKSNHKFSTALPLFEQLVSELMGVPDGKRLYPSCRIRKRFNIMEQRLESSTIARMLDQQERWRYLALSLWYDRTKLPAYLRRRLQGMPFKYHKSV